MSSSHRLVLAAGVFASLALAPTALRAQATSATPATPAAAAATDSLALPRQFVGWVFSGKGDSAFAQAGTKLRESMQSGQGVNTMASRILGRFGAMESTDTEVQFDEGPLKVYIAVMRFSNAPEPGAWVVAYDPTTKIVERAAFTSLSRVKTQYPQAKLP